MKTQVSIRTSEHLLLGHESCELFHVAWPMPSLPLCLTVMLTWLQNGGVCELAETVWSDRQSLWASWSSPVPCDTNKANVLRGGRHWFHDSYVHMNNKENKEQHNYDSFLHACCVSEFQEIKPHFKRNIYFRLEEAELLLENLWESDSSLVLSWIHPQIPVCPAPRPLASYTALSV